MTEAYAGNTVEARDAITPMRDNGFFAADSVARRVWIYPTSFLIGFARAVTIEHLDPHLAAAVVASGQVKQRTPLRFDRTMQYFATVLYGDAQSVLKSSDILMKVHKRAIGTDPVTGQDFSANNPDSQLWIHLTAWHSILITYEMFGPGKLSPEDEAEYWRECTVAAAFQTIDTENMPRTRAEVVQYFEDFRPKMVASEPALDMFEFLVNQYRSSLPHSIPLPIRNVVNAFTSRAVLATMPQWMREMGGTPQSPVVDVAIRAVMKPALAALHHGGPIKIAAVKFMTPRTFPIVAPYVMGVAPLEETVWDVADARTAFGFPRTPREIYAEQLAERRAGKIKGYEKNHKDEIIAFDTAGETGGTIRNRVQKDKVS
ncbi:hypothetical protein GCM10011584_31320 [Nocardioides phosphati]|uniref:ER-bound oxygenase mpaB/mpaB'/Rubber oxygenase catalytic domain-containing protein n=1 Tax=Nocardioides phosphati TaxID=1867775 RepID=A0ABQ2NED9_9ACTN|nr:oxygenase MpaB family protein [Nocardioides phosphati]GGO93190.1 hypothetical protein GCM10011584_31320 [Nocardioides phosphati]